MSHCTCKSIHNLGRKKPEFNPNVEPDPTARKKGIKVRKMALPVEIYLDNIISHIYKSFPL